MYEFRDLARLTTIACAFVAAHAVFDLLGSGADWWQGPAGVEELRSADALQLVNFLVLLSCLAIVGRWIYRASVNAHAISSEMTISPGWTIGWYFVPFANLVKPFEAMREIWLASHESSGTYEESVPLLRVWWGLWLITNMLSWIAFRMGEGSFGPALNFGVAILNVPLCIVLIAIMRDIASSQRAVRHELTFA